MATTADVTALYRELLGRDPDQGGLENWSRLPTAEAVRSGIMGSEEYQGRARQVAEWQRNKPVEDFIASDKAARQALIDRQNSEQQGLFSQYSNKIGGQEALPALYSRLQGEAGIPGLSQAAQGFKNEIYRVKDRLDRLGEDVTARTTGYNVSDAQRRRLEASEADPLTTNLARLGTGLAPVADMLTSAQSGVQNQLGLYAEQQNRELKPLEMQINSLSDRFAREITGFQQSHEDTLTNLLTKLQREQQLSDREWAAAQELAKEERDYTRQKSLATQQLSLSNNGTGGTTTSTPTKPPVDVSSYLSFGGSSGLQPLNYNSYPAGLGPLTTSKPTSNAIPLFNQQNLGSQGNPLGLRIN